MNKNQFLTACEIFFKQKISKYVCAEYQYIVVIFNSYLKILPNPKDFFSGSGLMDFSAESMVVDDLSVELEFVFESEDSMFL